MAVHCRESKWRPYIGGACHLLCFKPFQVSMPDDTPRSSRLDGNYLSIADSQKWDTLMNSKLCARAQLSEQPCNAALALLTRTASTFDIVMEGHAGSCTCFADILHNPAPDIVGVNHDMQTVLFPILASCCNRAL